MSSTRKDLKCIPPPPPAPGPHCFVSVKVPIVSHSTYDVNRIVESQNEEIEEHFAKSLKLNDEFIKNEMMHLSVFEAKKLLQTSACNLVDNIGVLIVSSIVQPVLQKGPLCGLVALAMAAQKYNVEVKVPLIFEEAKKRGYSKSGEMFCVENMMNLGTYILGCQAMIVDTREQNSQSVILTNILNGNLVLVPYDADFNHRPATRKGHAAHWALILGLALFVSTKQFESIQHLSEKTREEIPVLVLDPTDINKQQNEIITEYIKTLPNERIYVTARQGKSKLVGLWNYTELIRSNQNLVEISPKITTKLEEFILYPLETSLCHKAIVFNR